MAYRIQYGETVTKEILSEPTKTDKSIIRIVATLICCCVVLFVIAGNFTNIMDAVVPGNKDVTRAAFSSLVDNIKGGEPAIEAFADFCHEIVDNANLPN